MKNQTNARNTRQTKARQAESHSIQTTKSQETHKKTAQKKSTQGRKHHKTGGRGKRGNRAAEKGKAALEDTGEGNPTPTELERRREKSPKLRGKSTYFILF